MNRKQTPIEIETALLLKSKRRCALCFHLNGEIGETNGQIAHLDQDPSNYAETNLAYLCMDHHSLYDSRTSQHKNYTIAEVKVYRSDLYRQLEKLVAPNKPITVKTPEQIRRERDIQNIQSALKTIHWPTLDEHIDELPKFMVHRIFHFYEGFNGTVKNSLFHINDPAMASEIKDLHRLWSETTGFGHHYRRIANGNYVFDNYPNNHQPFNDEQEKDWKHIQEAACQLRKAKDKLLQHLRADFLEIDIANLSDAAWTAYWKYMDA